MNTEQKGSKSLKWIVFGMIVIHVAFFLFLFSNKVEYHSDEIWNFGIANNQGTPHFFWDGTGEFTNMDEWVSARAFKDYLTVGENEKFDFANVYNNCIVDLSQPLYMFILHCICSLFPGEFNFVFLIPIQILAIIMAQVGMYGILKELKLPNILIICTMIFFAIASGGINMTIYMRAYALMVGFSNILLWINLKYYNDETPSLKIVFAMGVVVLLGTLTHMFFWTYAFAMGVVFFFGYIFKKQYKKCIKYCIGMMSGALLSLAFFPYIFGKTDVQMRVAHTNEIDVFKQIKMGLNCVFCNTIGIAPKPYVTYSGFRLFLYIVLASFVVVPLCFLFRKESWYVAFRGNCKTKLGVAGGELKSFFSDHGIVFVLLLVEFLVNVIVVANAVDYSTMGNGAIRYLFQAYVSLILMIVIVSKLVFDIVGKYVNKKVYLVALPTIVLAGVVLSNVIRPPMFLGKKASSGVTLSEINNSDIIIFSDYQWHSVCVAPYINDSNYFYYTGYDFDFKNRHDELIRDKDRDYYILFDTDVPIMQEMFKELSKEKYSGESVDLATYMADEAEFFKEEFTKVKEEIKDEGGFSKYETVGKGRNITFSYELVKYIR